MLYFMVFVSIILFFLLSIIFQFHIPETAVPIQIISQDSPGLENWGVSTGWKGGGEEEEKEKEKEE